MKWIGQHIWDYISRFRSDVYLEDIDSGTIASGGNLGLDSNNKIVKSANPAGEIDLTSEVTGTLPVANGGTGATSLTDNSVLTGTGTSPITAEANFTYSGSVMSLNAVTSTFTNNTSSTVIIENTGSSAAGGVLKLTNTKAGGNGDVSDLGGVINFLAKNDGGAATTIGEIRAEVTDPAAATHSSSLKFFLANEGVLCGTDHPGITIEGNTGTADIINVTLGHGAASTTTIAGTLTMGSTAFVNNSGVVQVATQGTIDHDSLANFVANEHIDWTGDVSASSVIHTNNITDLHGAGVDGSANQLLTDDGDGTITSESNLTWDGDDFTLSSSNLTKPLIVIESTGDHARAPAIYFKKDKGAAGATNDGSGEIHFLADNAAQEQTTFASIITTIAEAADTDEAGQLSLLTTTSNGSSSLTRNVIKGTGSSSAFTVDVDLGFGTASTTTVAGDLDIDGDTITAASNLTIDPGGTLELDSTGLMTLDSSAGIELNADGDSIAFKDGTTTLGTIDSSSVFMKQTKVTLSESDCNDLHNTPVTLVSAQGADKIIVPVSYLLLVDRDASTAQSASGCDMMISYDGSTTGGKYLGYMRRFMYNETGDRTYVINGNNSTSSENWDTNDPSNKPLKIAFDSACTSGSLDSIVVYTTYYVVDNS